MPLQAFDAAIELKPKLAAAHGNRANALRVLNRNSEALDSYENAVKHDIESASSWFGLTHVANALGKHGRAVQGAEKCLELKYNTDAAHNERAFALVKLGRAEEALPDILESAADTASAKHLAALVHAEVAVNAMREQDFKKAAENYAAANGLEKTFDATLNQSLCLMYLDDLDAAVALSQEAVDMSSENWKSYAALGSILLKMRKFEEAVGHLEKALSINSSAEAEIDFSVHYNLAVALMNIGREADAKAPLTFTVEKAPDNWCARALLGIVLIAESDYTACVDVLSKAIEMHEEARQDSSVLYNLGYSKLMLDAPAEALDYFQQAQKVDPSSKQVKEAIAALSAIEGIASAQKASPATPPDAPPAASTDAPPLRLPMRLLLRLPMRPPRTKLQPPRSLPSPFLRKLRKQTTKNLPSTAPPASSARSTRHSTTPSHAQRRS